MSSCTVSWLSIIIIHTHERNVTICGLCEHYPEYIHVHVVYQSMYIHVVYPSVHVHVMYPSTCINVVYMYTWCPSVHVHGVYQCTCRLCTPVYILYMLQYPRVHQSTSTCCVPIQHTKLCSLTFCLLLTCIETCLLQFLSYPSLLTISREITAELDKLTAVLEKLHAKIAGKYDDVRCLIPSLYTNMSNV